MGIYLRRLLQRYNMQPIKQTTGIITSVRDLSPTAREYTVTPAEPLAFTAGAFVNTFFEHNGKTIRRAFSLSSSDTDNQSFTLSIRHNLQGELTPILWEHDFTGKTIKLMGPLGLNTADKMPANKIFLFGFGIGAGVVKSLADHMVKRPELEQLTIITGNRSIDEILHQDYFDTLDKEHNKVSVTYIVSDKNQSQYKTGYIQDHVQAYDFADSNVYICGQTVACTALQTAIENRQPKNCHFFIEDFH